MKTYYAVLKKIGLPSVILFFLFGMTACGQREADSKEAAQELNKPNSDVAKERDERFLVNTTEYNFEEIMLSKLAQERATTNDVKTMAQMLENDHKKSNDQLHATASSKSIAVPTAAPKSVMDDYDKFTMKDAKDFDADYCNKIVESHKDLINKLEDYCKGECDQDIKIWALSILPEERIHLQKAQEMADKVKNSVSQAGK